MQLINAPSKVPLPFAADGSKTAPFPEASQIGVTPGAASLTDGFPPLTMTPVASGGIAPSGLDMNGVLFLISAISRWQNAGAGYTFDNTFATDTNVGGYPEGARLLRSDGKGYWLNTVDNNVTNPETSVSAAIAAGWVPDFTSGAAAITMTNANVTLTALQYGQPMFIITGTLAANLQLIFPQSVSDSWVIINNTTGAFTITATTTGGTTTPLLAGAQYIVSDGTNISSLTQSVTATQIQSVSSSVSSNTLITGYAGGTLQFRNGTLTNGTPTNLVVGALALTVPSTATLGTVSTVATTLALIVAYNAGTPVLCIANVSGGTPLDETTLISPTTISTGATSASVIYSASTVAANSPFRVVGYIAITEATAGTWATAPTLVQGAGGQAFAALQSIGYGQIWQDVTGSRAYSTTYYNTTSRPIMVQVTSTNTSDSDIALFINSIQINRNGIATASQVCVTGIVPPGKSYSCAVQAGSAALAIWTELR